MSKQLALCALATLWLSSYANAGDTEEILGEEEAGPNTVHGLPNWEPPGYVLYDNGEFVNGFGTGVGGADESILQNFTLVMNTLGFGHQAPPSNNRIADEFVVPEGGWEIVGFVFFAYQTNGGIPSTITAVNYQIWDGPPGPESKVVYGDTTTNQMILTEWAGVYRVAETTSGDNSRRAIMADLTSAEIGGGLVLPEGEYWVDWQTAGSASSGPWAPPITINGECETGNGVQSVDGSAEYGPTNDSNTGCPQGFPFMILGEPPTSARFAVDKDFDDDNENEVTVTISCNTGLPLEQSTTISEGDGVNFVVTDFVDGMLDCEVFETGIPGYTTSYDDGQSSSTIACVHSSVFLGEQRQCTITNSLQGVEVEVTKEWIDENPRFQDLNYAEARYECINAAFVDCDGQSCACQEGQPGGVCGFLEFFGNLDTETFSVFPDWREGTECGITEIHVPDGGIETDDSDCVSITVWPGLGASCTIYNTRLYEGIPTLSQFGLGMLALLMMGVGVAGFRRFS